MQIPSVDPDLHEDILDYIFCFMGILKKISDETIETEIILLEKDFKT